MRRDCRWCSLSVILLAGCVGSSTTLPPESQFESPVAPGTPATGLLASAIYEVHLDLDSLQGTIEARRTRTAAANDDLYLTSLESLMKPDTLRLDFIRRTDTTLDLGIRITHPFLVPSNPAGPPSASNRADLGFTGVLCSLFDVATADGHTFFTDRITNTALATNADAYYSPEGLLPSTGTLANTFPVHAIVSERGATGSRLGLSNAGLPTGNYGTDGWTRSELGANRNGWTGYGVLHQGQSSRRTISLSLAELEAADSLDFAIALLARYNDPRGGATVDERLANRLPPATPDALKFAYRMPHGAWDIPRITYRGNSNTYVSGIPQIATHYFHVEDWDIAATPTTELDLSADPDPTHVPPGTEALPLLALCIPGVTGDTTVALDWNATQSRAQNDMDFGGDYWPDSGLPGDALFFVNDVRSIDQPQIGVKAGLFRVTDPEANLPSLAIPLAPDLTPLTANPPAAVAYQAFTVEVIPAIPFTGGWLYQRPPQTPTALRVRDDGSTVIATSFNTLTSFGGPYRTHVGSTDFAVVAIDAQGQWSWDYEAECAGFDGITDMEVMTDGSVWIAGDYHLAPIEFLQTSLPNLGESDLFVAHLSEEGLPLSFFRTGGATTDSPVRMEIDPSGDIVLFGGSIGETTWFNSVIPQNPGGANLHPIVGKGSPDGTTLRWAKRLDPGMFSSTAEMDIDSTGAVTVAGFYALGMTIDGHVLPSTPCPRDAYAAQFSNTGSYRWSKYWSDSQGTRPTQVDTLVVLPDDRVVFAGEMAGRNDFGGGEYMSDWIATWMLCLDQEGEYRWQYIFDSPGVELPTKLVMHEGTGNVLLLGTYTDPIDFGGGLRPNNSEIGLYLASFSTMGTYRWDSTWADAPELTVEGIGTGLDRTIRLGGAASPSDDLDPGPGTANIANISGFVIPLSMDGKF